jgi:hypothetical protein
VGHHKKKCRDVVAEAIFTSKQVEELAQVQWLTVFAFVFTELSRLPKDFFMRNRPRNAGDRKTQQEKKPQLTSQRIHNGVN